MEKLDQPFIFQSDSPIVKAAYETNDNFLIEHDYSQENTYCAIYFCSNNIYYPNTEISFKENIIDKNRFEWYGTRIKYAHKHIFIRDIKKQWYLTGINAVIDSPDALLSFLTEQTKGYKIVALGSSAGGYAATLYGSLLNAQLIFSFNGQFEIQSLLQKSSELVNPILFRFYRNNQLLDFFDTKAFIKNASKVFYFYSNKSAIDLAQKKHISNIGLNLIGFNTSHHGVPFLKCNLPVILDKSPQELVKLAGKIHNPLRFSIQNVGFKKTVKGIFFQVFKRFFN